MQTARWGKFRFKVSEKKINSFSDLTIKGSIKTEEKTKTKNSQEVVVKKTTKATEISMTAHLYAATGCNVRSEAMKLVETARKGKNGYFYIGKKKLVSYKLKLIEAEIKEVTFYGKMQWYAADVALTFKQSKAKSKSSSDSSSGSGSSSSSSGGGGSANTGEAGSAGGGSNKASVRTQTPVSTSGSSKIRGRATGTASSGSSSKDAIKTPSASTVRSASEVIKQMQRDAKATTAENKSTSKTIVNK